MGVLDRSNLMKENREQWSCRVRWRTKKGSYMRLDWTMGLRSKKRNKSREVIDVEINEYLTKKAEKKELSATKKLKDHNISGYSNDSNPFRDSNLNEKSFGTCL